MVIEFVVDGQSALLFIWLSNTYTVSQKNRENFKRLYLLYGLSNFYNILQPWTRNVSKYACQISSDLILSRARYDDLNGRDKKRGFQAGNGNSIMLHSHWKPQYGTCTLYHQKLVTETKLKTSNKSSISFFNLCGPEKGCFVDAVLWELMLEVSTVSFYAGCETNTPLLDWYVDDVLTEQAPVLHETLLQMLNVTYPATINSL